MREHFRVAGARDAEQPLIQLRWPEACDVFRIANYFGRRLFQSLDVLKQEARCFGNGNAGRDIGDGSSVSFAVFRIKCVLAWRRVSFLPSAVGSELVPEGHTIRVEKLRVIAWYTLPRA